MRKHDERQRLLAIAERSPWKLWLSWADVCISAHFVVILVGDAPRLPPERPLAWSPASSQLLHKGRELSAVHLDGLREAGLQDGSVFAEPVSTSLPLLLLFPVIGQDFAVCLLRCLQLILVLGLFASSSSMLIFIYVLLWCTRVMQACTTLMQMSLCSLMGLHHFDANNVKSAAD